MQGSFAIKANFITTISILLLYTINCQIMHTSLSFVIENMKIDDGLMLNRHYKVFDN